MMDIKHEKDIEGLALSQSNDVHNSAIQNHDDVFGEITDSGPNYRNVCLVSSFRVSLFSIPCFGHFSSLPLFELVQ
mgnify:CR=1 FL=1